MPEPLLKQGPKGKYTWQFNGVAEWSGIVEWCAIHIPNGCWHNGWETFCFAEEKYYTFFLLRWT